MISLIKKIIFGKNAVQIKTATSKNKEITYFQVLHPFLTRREVNKLMSTFYAQYCNKPTPSPLVFEEVPNIFQKIKNFFGSNSSLI